MISPIKISSYEVTQNVGFFFGFCFFGSVIKLASLFMPTFISFILLLLFSWRLKKVKP